jgi:hypothetical protein
MRPRLRSRSALVRDGWNRRLVERKKTINGDDPDNTPGRRGCRVTHGCPPCSLR